MTASLEHCTPKLSPINLIYSNYSSPKKYLNCIVEIIIVYIMVYKIKKLYIQYKDFQNKQYHQNLHAKVSQFFARVSFRVFSDIWFNGFINIQ
jgi:hypothetical protein